MAAESLPPRRMSAFPVARLRHWLTRGGAGGKAERRRPGIVRKCLKELWLAERQLRGIGSLEMIKNDHF